MLIINESEARQLLSEEEALIAVEQVFKAMDNNKARNFPVVREQLGHAGAVYGIKSAFDGDGLVLGLKAGGYWPHNLQSGQSNHQSCVVLFDPDSGMATALISANYLTAVRTAAATAVSVKYLSRRDASVLGIIGAGNQAAHQIRAVANVRPVKRIVAWNRDVRKLEKLAEQVADIAPLESNTPANTAREAEILITITSASEALIASEWVNPGTHIAAMGVDTAGKQELPPDLLSSASVFTDSLEQAISIGECQHAVKEKILEQAEIVEIGTVLNSRHPGRQSDEAITLFDGTGVALQDLAVAALIVERAKSANLGYQIEL